MAEAASTSDLFSARFIGGLLNITDRRVRQLAREGVIPRAERGKYPLAGCVRAYVKFLQAHGTGSEGTDPDTLPPFQRKAYYQSELEKLKLEQERRELIPRIETEQEMAGLLKIVAECLDTLPDILERDCGLQASVLVKMEAVLDRAREDLHMRLVEEEEEDARGASGSSA